MTDDELSALVKKEVGDALKSGVADVVKSALADAMKSTDEPKGGDDAGNASGAGAGSSAVGDSGTGDAGAGSGGEGGKGGDGDTETPVEKAMKSGFAALEKSLDEKIAKALAPGETETEVTKSEGSFL